MKSCPHAQSKLVSPSGRDVAQRQRGLAHYPLHTNQTCLSLRERCRAATERACTNYILPPVCPDTNGASSRPLSHLLCKCQLSQRESQEAGASWESDESGGFDADCLRVCPLSHLLRKCQLSQRESQEAGSLTNQRGFDTHLPACCSFRHGLRRATFLREKGFCSTFPFTTNCRIAIIKASKTIERNGG